MNVKSFLLTRWLLLPSTSDPRRAIVSTYCQDLVSFTIDIDEGTKLFIDPKASMFIFGTEMDYVEDKLESGFVFRNPNEKARCGCGESFHV